MSAESHQLWDWVQGPKTEAAGIICGDFKAQTGSHSSSKRSMALVSPALPLTSWVAVSNILTVSEPLFSHHKVGIVMVLNLGDCFANKMSYYW